MHNLKQAEQLTPAQTRTHRIAGQVARDLLQLAGLRLRPELRDLAERFGVLRDWTDPQAAAHAVTVTLNALSTPWAVLATDGAYKRCGTSASPTGRTLQTATPVSWLLSSPSAKPGRRPTTPTDGSSPGPNVTTTRASRS